MINNNFYTFSKYLEDNPLTISEEDYLELIYRLCLINKFTRIKDIATNLNIKPPSASSMIRKLKEKQLVAHSDYGIVRLTKKGEEIGKTLLERHQSIEEFLKLLNIKENILEETEKIEHTLSPTTIYKINKLLAFMREHPNIQQELNLYLEE